jgi:translation initiation factor IF-3
MKRTWRRPQKKEEVKRFRSNQQIRVPEIFLIDENGTPVGRMTTQEALKQAEEAGLDLIEVNPTADPPVCKFLDYGQFKYEQEKLAHKQKALQKKVEIKNIRLTVKIGANDFNFKVEQAKGFLKKGNKVKIDIVLRGRERQHPDKAVDNIKRFVALLYEDKELNLAKEQDLTRKDGGFNIILLNKTA